MDQYRCWCPDWGIEEIEAVTIESAYPEWAAAAAAELLNDDFSRGTVTVIVDGVAYDVSIETEIVYHGTPQKERAT